jgi:hypothetical protein
MQKLLRSYIKLLPRYTKFKKILQDEKDRRQRGPRSVQMYLKENYDRAKSSVEPAPISVKMDISPDRKPAKVIERQSSIKDGFLKPCYNLKLVNEDERTLLLINQIVIGKNEDNATDKLMNIIDEKIENG